MEKREPRQPGAPQPNVPPESDSGRPSDLIDRDEGARAWQRHSSSHEDSEDSSPPTSEFTDEPPAPGEQEDASDSG